MRHAVQGAAAVAVGAPGAKWRQRRAGLLLRKAARGMPLRAPDVNQSGTLRMTESTHKTPMPLGRQQLRR